MSGLMLDPLVTAFQAPQQLGSGLPEDRMNDLGSDLRERHEDECALGELGVRHLQGGARNHAASVEQDVHIDGARAVYFQTYPCRTLDPTAHRPSPCVSDHRSGSSGSRSVSTTTTQLRNWQPWSSRYIGSVS